MEKVKARSYTLRYENGAWLGQVLISSDGMFSAVTDWGSFSYCWRAYNDTNFRQFLVELDKCYFASKMYSGMGYVASGRKVEKAAYQFAEKILPAFQSLLREDIITNPTF